jgi:Co/Zn/Cd efflux system component
VIASAAAVWAGVDAADPLVGLGISVLILRVTWQACRTVHGGARART